jgi:hypothetical protein
MVFYAVRDARRRLEEIEYAAVAVARGAQWSWRTIADVLGISRRSAQALRTLGQRLDGSVQLLAVDDSRHEDDRAPVGDSVDHPVISHTEPSPRTPSGECLDIESRRLRIRAECGQGVDDSPRGCVGHRVEVLHGAAGEADIRHRSEPAISAVRA